MVFAAGEWGFVLHFRHAAGTVWARDEIQRSLNCHLLNYHLSKLML